MANSPPDEIDGFCQQFQYIVAALPDVGVEGYILDKELHRALGIAKSRAVTGCRSSTAMAELSART